MEKTHLQLQQHNLDFRLVFLSDQESMRRLLLIMVVIALLVYEDCVSIPSCKVVPGPNPKVDAGLESTGEEEDLNVMMVANLLLLGSEATYVNIFFRDYYLSKFFKKSFEILKPDMLLVLGDVSARGAELSRSKWSSVLQQFHSLLGPFLGLPFHVVLGDRDIGGCSGLDSRSVDSTSSNFPGLDSAGSGAFEISNINFVSLNSVALLCGNNELRFSVEKAVERESIELQMESKHGSNLMNSSTGIRFHSGDTGWRENAASSGSGPVVLLHFPLHQTSKYCWESNVFEGNFDSSRESAKAPNRRKLVGPGPYHLSHTLPPNASEYIFQALRPRMIFSAHAHKFCDRTHPDGTREISVPAMSWDAGDDPGFVTTTFRSNGSIVIVSHCTLSRESHVLLFYFSVMLVLISIVLVTNTSHQTNSGT